MDRFEMATGKSAPTYHRKSYGVGCFEIVWAEGGNFPKLTYRRRRIDWSENGWAVSVDTAQELLEELDRQMTGLKDRHDRAIDQYMTAYEGIKKDE
jgi:hypothetical protein